jgi:hypothetical protein
MLFKTRSVTAIAGPEETVRNAFAALPPDVRKGCALS